MSSSSTGIKRRLRVNGEAQHSNDTAKKARSSTFFSLLCAFDEKTQLCHLSDVKSAMTCVLGLAEWSTLAASSIPPVVLRHQLYALLSDRSQVDREVSQLISEHAVVQVQVDRETYGLISVEDFVKTVEHIVDSCGVASDIRDKFVSAVRKGHVEVSMRRDRLLQLTNLTDPDISVLTRCGLVAIRDAHTIWLSIPNAYVLARALKDGRQAVLNAIRRTKFKEVLLGELLKKRASRTLLDIRYCVLDLVGSETVTFIETTSGAMLRQTS